MEDEILRFNCFPNSDIEVTEVNYDPLYLINFLTQKRKQLIETINNHNQKGISCEDLKAELKYFHAVEQCMYALWLSTLRELKRSGS